MCISVRKCQILNFIIFFDLSSEDLEINIFWFDLNCAKLKTGWIEDTLITNELKLSSCRDGQILAYSSTIIFDFF